MSCLLCVKYNYVFFVLFYDMTASGRFGRDLNISALSIFLYSMLFFMCAMILK